MTFLITVFILKLSAVNTIGDNGANAMSKVLKENTTLTELYLYSMHKAFDNNQWQSSNHSYSLFQKVMELAALVHNR